MFHEFFPKNVEKYGGDREGPQTTIWRRASCWISKATLAQAHGRARAATTPPPHTHTHTRARAHSRAQALTQLCNTNCFSTATMVS
jgi:hypothetical protein